MFSKSYGAQIQEFNLYQSRIRKEVKRTFSLGVKYDFTDGLAGAIGGHAVEIQRMLSQGGELPARLAGAPIHLDTNNVRVMLTASKEEKLQIDYTVSMTAHAKPPTADAGTIPSLDVRLIFPAGDDDAAASRFMDFCHANIGKTIKVRMDRKQMDLDLSPKDGKKDEAPKDEPKE